MQDSNNTTHVYKASAGSGKTFRLAVEYLKLILKDKNCFKSILAVTFTNKATSEMKDRILYELYGLHRKLEDSDTYRDKLIEDLGPDWDADKISQKAGEAINAIIHDYSRFRIETIDSFFQSVLRNLIHELEIGSAINLELDNKQVIHEAVDDIMDSLHEPSNKNILDWLTKFSMENLNNGYSWRVNGSVEKFATNIFNEDFITKMDDDLDLDTTYSIEKLSAYKKEMQDRFNLHINKLKGMAEAFFISVDAWNAVSDNFYYGKNGLWSYFNKMKNGYYCDEKLPGNNVIKSIGDVTKIEASNKTQRNHNVQPALIHKLLCDTEKYRIEHLEEMATCETVLKNINNIGLLYDIKSVVRRNNEMNGKFLLGDTAVLLNKIMDGNTTPFIYEKIGTTLRHIMIDEFQDTSKLQWKNFYPLLEDTVDNGGSNLIVGDPKQAIYRWRNGDWRIIENLYDDEHLRVVSTSMNDNYRSMRSVIEFNNAIFKNCIPFIPEGDALIYKQIENIYNDVRQNCKKVGDKGYVKYQIVNKVDGEKNDETILKVMVEQIKKLKKEGIDENDIAILVRGNKDTAKIAKHLSDCKKNGELPKDEYNIVSSEAFRLDNSVCVNIIINALKFIVNQADDISLHRMYLDFVSLNGDKYGKDSAEFEKVKNDIIATSTLPLYEMIEEIYFILRLSEIPDNGVYMQLFLDKVNNFINRKSSDLVLFIKHWDEKLCEATLSSSNDSKGMRILTIHKSKGLQFKTVIIPFADWEIEGFKGDVLWCKTEVEPYNAISPVPINYNKKLPYTVFSGEYNSEKAQMWIDNINILYVAFTRAEHNLIVFSPEPSDSSKKTLDDPKRINVLLASIFANKARLLSDEESNVLAKNWNEADKIFEYGELYVYKKKEDKATANVLKQKPEKITLDYVNYRINSDSSQPSAIKFRQSEQSKKFLKDPEGYGSEHQKKISEFMERGKVMHALFSDINTIDDVEKAVKRQVYAGIISKDETEKYISYIREKIESTPKEWFSKSAKVLNERSIITKKRENGRLKVESKRPDRVVMVDGKVIIIDYKFGDEFVKYEGQVKEYAELMKKMGYGNVEAYLWYVEKGEIEVVNI